LEYTRLYITVPCGSLSVWNVLSDTKGETQSEGIWEQGAAENMQILCERGMRW
jgi:hypothetical protein